MANGRAQVGGGLDTGFGKKAALLNVIERCLLGAFNTVNCPVLSLHKRPNFLRKMAEIQIPPPGCSVTAGTTMFLQNWPEGGI